MPRTTGSVFLLFGVAALLPLSDSAGYDDVKSATAGRRYPIALTLIDGGKRLLVANRNAGTIMTVDALAMRPIAETQVGGRLSDLCITPANDLVLATDEQANEL